MSMITNVFKKHAPAVVLAVSSTVGLSACATGTVYTPREAGNRAEAGVSALSKLACGLMSGKDARLCRDLARDAGKAAKAEAEARAGTQGLCEDREQTSSTTTNGRVTEQERTSQDCVGRSPRNP